MIRLVALTAAAGALAASLATAAQPAEIGLPFGDIPAELGEPDAQVVVRHCSACHSLDYITTQPRGKGEQFWRDSVTKMINVYGAPLSAEEAEAVAATLAHKLG
jgi:predicted secreted protein